MGGLEPSVAGVGPALEGVLKRDLHISLFQAAPSATGEAKEAKYTMPSLTFLSPLANWGHVQEHFIVWMHQVATG